jgi:autotransporter-associated beta strand protein
MTTTNTPRRSVHLVRATLIGAALAALMAAPSAFGVTQTKNSTAGALNAGASWVSGTAPTGTDVGLFNSVTGAAQIDSVGGAYTIGELQLTNPTGLITISDPLATNYLTINGVGGVGIDMSSSTQSLTMNAGVTLGASQTWNIAPGRTLTMSGNQQMGFGSNVLTINGGGTLSVTWLANSATNSTLGSSSTGAGLVVNGSTFNYVPTSNSTSTFQAPASPTAANYMGANTALTMAGSTIIIGVGSSTGTQLQNWTSLTMNPGSSLFQANGRTSSSTLRQTFPTLSRNDGAIADFAANSSSNSYFFTGTESTVLGWATFVGNDIGVTNSTGDVVAATYASDTWVSTGNINVTTSSTQTAASTAKDLRFNTALSNTVTLSGTNTLSTGEILVGSTTAANTETITGGSLTSGDTNADTTHDLIIINNDSAAGAGGNLVINSAIVDNGANSVGLTVGGTNTSASTSDGAVVLGGVNTFTGAVYIDGGTLILNNSGAWGGQNSVNFAPRGNISYANSGGTFSLNGNSITANGLTSTQSGGSFNPVVQNANATGATMTINVASGSDNFNGTVKDGTGGGSLSITKTGAGTETLGGVLSYSGPTNVQTGDLVLKNAPTATSGFTVNGTLDVTATGITVNSALSGTGTVLGSVTLGTGSVTNPGGATAVGLLTIGSLTLNTGSATDFEFGSGVNDEITTTTALTFGSASGLFNLYTLSGQQVTTDGTYTLFNWSGFVTGNSSLSAASILNPAGGLSYAFGGTSNSITLTISGNASTNANWTGNSSANWSLGTNWIGGTAPSLPTDQANFVTNTSGNYAVSLDTSETVGQAVFNSSSNYTIGAGGGTLTLDNGSSSSALVTDQVGNHTIAAPIALSTNATNTVVTVTRAQDTLSISGGIAGSGGTAITVAGLGTVSLSGTNTVGGGFFLNGGLLEFTTSALGSSALTFGGGGLEWAPANTQDISGTNTLTFNSGGGTLNVGANTVTLASPIGNSGTGGLTVMGTTGTLILTASNPFSGGITLAGGTVQAGSLNNLGSTSTAITFNGGTLQFAPSSIYDISTRTVTIAPGGATIDTNGQDETLSGAIGNGGSGSLTKVGNGNLFVNAVATYTGTTTVNGGTLDEGIAGAFPVAGLVVGASGIFNASTFAQSFNSVTGTGQVALGTGATLSDGGVSTTSSFAGNISGTGTFAKVGTGTVTLSGTSTTTGPITSSGGELVFGSTAVLNTVGAITANSGDEIYVHGATIDSTGTLGPAGSLSANTLFYLQDAGTTTYSAVQSSTGTDGSNITISGGTLNTSTVTLGRTGNVSATLTSPFTTGLIVSGTGSVVTTGNITAGSANSFGTVSVQGTGSLSVGGALILGQQMTGGRGGVLQVLGGTLNVPDTVNGLVIVGFAPAGVSQLANATFAGGQSSFGIINFGGNSSVTTGSIGAINLSGGNLLVGSGGIQNPGVGMTVGINLTGGNLGATSNWSSALAMTAGGGTIMAGDGNGVGHNITLTGVISGGSLTKTGNGILSLNNAAETLTGPLTINGGTLSIPQSGGAIDTAGQVNLAAGTLAGGQTGSSTLLVDNLSWSPGAKIAAILTDGSTNSDLIDMADLGGTLNLTGNGGTYNFDFSGSDITSASIGNVYTLISFASESGDATANFNAIGGIPGTFANNVGDDGLLTFTVTGVPEPGVYALAMGGAALVIGLRRRRRANASYSTRQSSTPHDCNTSPSSSS